jgi:pimeloyl-ACP methyl ester carboxylesterase
VSILGASMGGAVAGEAVAEAKRDEVARVVYLSPAPLPPPERQRGPAVFVASVGEPAIARIREDFERAPEPKRLVLVPGTAHAQHAFHTAYGPQLTAALVDALTTP